MNPEAIGLLAGLLTTGAAIPQIIKSHKSKRAKDISLLYFATIVIGLLIWLVYGILIESISLITWNILSLALNITILTQKIHYDFLNRTSKKR